MDVITYPCPNFGNSMLLNEVLEVLSGAMGSYYRVSEPQSRGGWSLQVYIHYSSNPYWANMIGKSATYSLLLILLFVLVSSDYVFTTSLLSFEQTSATFKKNTNVSIIKMLWTAVSAKFRQFCTCLNVEGHENITKWDPNVLPNDRLSINVTIKFGTPNYAVDITYFHNGADGTHLVTICYLAVSCVVLLLLPLPTHSAYVELGTNIWIVTYLSWFATETRYGYLDSDIWLLVYWYWNSVRIFR